MRFAAISTLSHSGLENHRTIVSKLGRIYAKISLVLQLRLKHNDKTCYIAPRLRGHGCKDDMKGKFHISRLAKDVHDFIQWLKKKQICAQNQQFSFVGTSMGCAIIWSFVELFGESEVKNYTFVDQAPLQNMRDDWCLGSTGCFDEA